MKTPLLILALITSVFSTQIYGQNRTIVNAMNSEISDNLDLRVVASHFGDSRNLEDFERRLNDPKLQISNLDLNYDGQVDYLRVIEAIEKRTHIIIIQSVLNRDLYQDVATIEIEKTRNKNLRVQIVGNSFFYGTNYIYEPEYCYTPIIYSSFWIPNYRPYYSNWCWNYYPSYYYAWHTYPTFRYRYNVNICLNNYSYNSYNYVHHRRGGSAAQAYNNRRANGYESQYPHHSFSNRNTTVPNRYELELVRNSRNNSSRNAIGYSQNRTENQRDISAQRQGSRVEYTPNRTETPRQDAPQRDYSHNRTETTRQAAPQRDNSQNRTETPRQDAPQRDYSQNRTETPRQDAPQRDYSHNRTETPRQAAPQRDYSQNRTETPRQDAPQRDYSQNRTETPRQTATQRVEPTGENYTSRTGNRRG
jgi:hypothetical protein